MKITFLGTSHGVPAADRYCSSIMLEAGDAIYFIDAGAPVMDEILRKGRDINKVRAVFNTHSHGDHINGVLPLADLVNWYYKKAAIDFYFTEQHVADAFEKVIEAVDCPLDTERVRFHTVTSDFIYKDENIRVSLIPTKHMANVSRPSYAILVESEGKKALFSGDLSYMLREKDVPEIVSKEEIDVFVCEMAHFGVEQLMPYLKTCKAKSVYFTHIFPYSRFDEIRAVQNDFDYPITIVDDGSEIVL
ncbi:MAG: MBL fold metallo-hydrolase [Ruminococcaceae bacterium]|nr:MBL fold metallo-hydrolase [Oscillospiraceae bacterium]